MTMIINRLSFIFTLITMADYDKTHFTILGILFLICT